MWFDRHDPIGKRRPVRGFRLAAPGGWPIGPLWFGAGLCLALVTGQTHAGGSASGVYSEPQALRGEALYLQHCVACHGTHLEGSPAAALTGPAFRARWEDGSHTLDDLYYIVRTLMPNTAPGSLSKTEYADVVAYILRVNGYPIGETDLVPKGAIMKPVVLQPH